MRVLRILTTLAPVLLLATAGAAQELEVGPLMTFGYTTSSAFDVVAPGISNAAIRGGFTWGGQVTRHFGRRLGAELSFTQQRSAFEIEVGDKRADLFDLDIGQLHGGVVYELRDSRARVRPFLTAGAGLAFLSSRDLEGETKFSWAVGGGLKAYFGSTLGIRVQARFLQTRLGGEPGDPGCFPFGFCKPSLDQAEILTGVIFRF